MEFEAFRQLIRDGDLSSVKSALNAQPELLFTSDLSDEFWQERSALHTAALHGHFDCVQFFVEAGAEVYSHHHASYPPVFVAYYSDSPHKEQIVNYFLKEIPDRAAGTMGQGITIHLAARLGFTEIVRRHLEIDPLVVSQRGWLGDTPLHWSAHNGHLDIVRMLLDAGADIEADEINCYGGKPLHWAAEHEPAIVKLLLERGAQVDSINQLQRSDYCGVTPLLMNAHQRDDCAEVTRLLLDAGADPHAKHAGKSAAQIATEKGNQAILTVLKEYDDHSVSSPGASPPVPRVPARPERANKGTFGSVLVFGGSSSMAGAASLSGQAALHGGAGLVTVAVPSEVAPIVASMHPAYMTLSLGGSPLDTPSGEQARNYADEIAARWDRHSALAVGPGLGQASTTQASIRQIYQTCPLPLVLDADGLNAFVASPEQIQASELPAPRILTPHPGEFSRLTGRTVAEVEASRIDTARAFAKQMGVTLLLKGHRTIITDGTRLRINRTGCNALATGGSGDILTGLIAALLAQGMTSFDAAVLGAHLHGLAGERAGAKYGAAYVTAIEILESLSSAWRDLPPGDSC